MDSTSYTSFEDNEKFKRRFFILLLSLIVVLIISVILSVSVGSLKIQPSVSYRILINKLLGITIGDQSELIGNANYNMDDSFS